MTSAGITNASSQRAGTLGSVESSIGPHLAQEGMPGNPMAEAERWAASTSGPASMIDVVSEGH